MSLLCDAIQWPGKTVDSAAVNIFGEHRIFPTGTISYDEISLSFICDSGLQVLDEFNKWHNQVYNTKSRKANYYSSYVRDIELSILTRAEDSSNINKLRKITLKECWPKTISSFSLGHALNNHLSLTVTLAYKWFEDNLTASQSTDVPPQNPQTPMYQGSNNIIQNSLPDQNDQSAAYIDFSGGDSPMNSYLDTLSNSCDIASMINSSSLSLPLVNGNPLDSSMISSFGSFSGALQSSLSGLNSSLSGVLSASSLGQPIDHSLVHTNITASLQRMIDSNTNLSASLNSYASRYSPTFVDSSGNTQSIATLATRVSASNSGISASLSTLNSFTTVPGTLNSGAAGSTAYQTAISGALNTSMRSLGPIQSSIAATGYFSSASALPTIGTPKVVALSSTPFQSLALNTPSASNFISSFF